MLTDGGEGLSGGVQVGGGLELLVGPAVVGVAGESSAGDVSDDGGAVDTVSGSDVTDEVAGQVRLQEFVDLIRCEASLNPPSRARGGRVWIPSHLLFRVRFWAAGSLLTRLRRPSTSPPMGLGPF